MLWKINQISSEDAVNFAVKELTHYLTLMNPDLEFEIGKSSESDSSETLVIGCSVDFDEFLPDVSDKTLDDAILINVKNKAGIITGTNARSVLLAVYRYLKELGCAFIRPGRDNEVIPPGNPEEKEVKVCDAASHRHREVCIEGAASFEHVRDMIDWIPKIGMNGYFMQFMKPYGFFRNWYNHEGNPYMEPEPKSDSELDEIVKKLEDEIYKRGLLYFTVGHSWNSEPFGIEASYWDEAPEPPEGIRKYLAELGGKRDWYKGVPMNTNLCYSNPEVQEIITDYAVKYCIDHPKISYLVFWVADAFGNRCECKECRKKNFADYYFQLLNLLDEKLTALGISTKIAFSVKATLPKDERLRRSDRILMMFNPMLRNFAIPYPDEAYEEELPEIPVFPDNISFEELYDYYKKDGSRYVGLFKNWQNVYGGDTLTFDYQLIWYVQRCPANILSAKHMSADIKNHKRTGANGVNSCQVQRLFFPTALPMVVMAETLWNRDAEFEDIAARYFEAAFGSDGAMLFELLSRLDIEEIIRGVCGFAGREWHEHAGDLTRQKINEAYPVIDKLKELIEKNVNNSEHSGAVRQSWKYLEYYPEFATLYMNVFMSSFGENNAEKTDENCKKLCDFVNRHEKELHRVIDGFTFRLRLTEDYKKDSIEVDVHK